MVFFIDKIGGYTMKNTIKIIEMYPKSFKANVYTIDPFRMIGLIDINIKYIYGVERVTLAYFRSSGTNSGKIKGLWYPIVGIKMNSGYFTEFTDDINLILTKCTKRGRAKEGWLAKSLFFDNESHRESKVRGFSSGTHYNSLLYIGETLRDLYEEGDFNKINYLDSKRLNEIIISNNIYYGNNHSQRYNYEEFIKDIFNERQN